MCKYMCICYNGFTIKINLLNKKYERFEDRRCALKNNVSSHLKWILTKVFSKTEHVFALFISNTKIVVLSVSCLAPRVFKLHSKLAWFFCQAVYLVQSESKLTIQISETVFVIIPATVEINRSVQSLLEHSPPSTGCCLVTVYLKGSSIVRVDGINTAVSNTSFIQLSTVFVDWKIMNSEASSSPCVFPL